MRQLLSSLWRRRLEKPVSVGQPEAQTLCPFSFLYETVETTLEKLPGVADKVLEAQVAALVKAQIPMMGPPVFIYRNMSSDMSKPFTVEMGLMVPDAAPALAPYKIRKTEPFPCVTTVYRGPLESICKAYRKVMPAAMILGSLTGEVREYYLYWEGSPAARNNLTLIAAGVK